MGLLENELEAGKRWVATKIRELSRARSRPVGAFQWEDPDDVQADDLVASTVAIVVRSGSHKAATRLAKADLKAVRGSRDIQQKLSLVLAEMLERL